MRMTFTETLVKIAEQDPRIILLTGDLGYMVLEPYIEKFPDRFINVGVAEQNMIGVATGLAEAGYIPWVYSIVTFATLRGYEFIRNGPILHQLPVRVVGIGGGVEYGVNGPTHQGLEDIAVMRTQPGLTVVAPADASQAKTAIYATWDSPRPIYYRLGKDDRTLIPELNGAFELGKLDHIIKGTEVLIISMGAITAEAVKAAHVLKSRGVSCGVCVVSSFNPSPSEELVSVLRQYNKVFTLESHYLSGGLGSFVAEVIADHGLACQIKRLGIQATPNQQIGTQAYLQGMLGISAECLVQSVQQVMH